MEVHYMPLTYCKKKMDALFLGIFNVVPCCVLWFLAEYQLEHMIEHQQGKTIYASHYTKILKKTPPY